jgi:hypothetical protein
MKTDLEEIPQGTISTRTHKKIPSGMTSTKIAQIPPGKRLQGITSMKTKQGPRERL